MSLGLNELIVNMLKGPWLICIEDEIYVTDLRLIEVTIRIKLLNSYVLDVFVNFHLQTLHIPGVYLMLFCKTDVLGFVNWEISIIQVEFGAIIMQSVFSKILKKDTP